MTEIANALVMKYDVKVICGPEVYDLNKKRDNDSKQILDHSIELHRVKGVIENKKSVLSRARKFMVISSRLFQVAKSKIKNGDVVFLVSNPFPLIIPMAKLRRKRDFKLVMLVHDVFPEGMINRFHLKGFLARWVMRNFNNAYAQADTLISLGRDMCDLLGCKTERKTKIVQIENWADLDNIHPLERTSSNEVVLQYAGNIGPAQGVQQIIEYVKEAKNPLLRLSIWGSGSMENALKKKVVEDGLSQIVTFYGPYLRSQQEQVLNDCDIAVVSLRDDMYGRGVPSKTYNILAAGKPVLYIGPANTEIGLMVEEEKIGIAFDNQDKEGIINWLRYVSPETVSNMGNNSRTVAEKHYSKQIILGKFCEVI